MLRIFLTSSHLSTFFMTLHARKTHRPGYTDLLLIDHFPKKRSLVKLIRETATLHPGFQVVDLSTPLEDSANLKPSLRKKLTRTWKTKPLFRNIYDLLYQRELGRASRRNRALLDRTLQLLDHSETELNLLAETALNGALINKFPGASINYFEHGLSDYTLEEKNKDRGAPFYCVFASAYKNYLQNKHKPSDHIKELITGNEFTDLCSQLIKQTSAGNYQDICKRGTDYALLLLQSVEQYHVDNSYWPGFLEKCLAKLKPDGGHTFIIKPHPLQANETIHLIEIYLKKRNIPFIVLNEALFNNLGIELVFGLWEGRVSHVFSPFSSGVFYLSQLYPNVGTQYCYSFDFMKGHLDRAPAVFRNNFLDAEKIVKEVFSVNCVAI